jgi:hypothetical protein
VHSVRVRDGERELEVHGTNGFCRQVLDELPVLMARLRGEGAASSRSSIALPAPQPAAEASPLEAAAPEAAPPANGNGHAAPGRAGAHAPDALDDQVIAVLRAAKRPLGITDIRAKLGREVSGQSLRRTLERDDRVVSMGGKPAAYSLR